MSKSSGRFRWGSTEQQEQFWAFVRIDEDWDECWAWTGASQPFGYGSYTLNGCKTTAHRIAYMLVFGPLEPGESVLHACDNAWCCNPRHLRAGTQLENVRDAIERGRAYFFPVRAGYAHPQAKMTDEQAAQVRKLYAETNMTQGQIAKHFEISQSHVARILQGMRFKGEKHDDIRRKPRNHRWLSDEQAAQIRAEYALGTKQAVLAARFGVSQVAVSKIVRSASHAKN